MSSGLVFLFCYIIKSDRLLVQNESSRIRSRLQYIKPNLGTLTVLTSEEVVTSSGCVVLIPAIFVAAHPSTT